MDKQQTSTTVETVRIRRTPSGFCNVPDGFRIVSEGEPNIHEYPEAIYRVPPGYHVALCEAEQLMFYDREGRYARIYEGRAGEPVLESNGALERVD